MTKFHLICRNLVAAALALVCYAPASAIYAFSDGTEVYGYLSSPASMNILNSEGYEEMWKDSGYSSRWMVPMTSGWLLDGKMCGYANDGYDAYYVEYNWESGEVLKSEELRATNTPAIATLNEADGKIYGFLMKGSDAKFFCASKDAPTELTLVATLARDEMCLGVTYNSTVGYIVGVHADGTLVKVNADGTQEIILNTNYAIPTEISYTALTYCATDALYYWNPTNTAWESEMYVIDSIERTISQVTAFPDKQFRFMLSPGAPIDPESPKAPEIVSWDFVDGSTDGKFVVRMPEEYESGEAITGTLNWTLAIDSETAKEGAAEAGSEVTVELSNIATGNHTFAFTATVGDKTGRAASCVVYVGFDIPKAPTNVVLTTTKLTWEAVTEGVNGGYVNPEAIVYTISLDGEKAGTTAGLEYTFEDLNQGELRRLVAEVTATANEQTSAPGLSNVLDVGTLSIPVFMQPTADDFSFCTTFDGDDDGKSWSYNKSNSAFYATFNPSAEVDDWLILPAINMTAETAYSLSFEARRYYSMYPDDAIEVRAAQEPTVEALATGEMVIEKVYLAADFEELNGTFMPTESGKWYIALHAVSDPDQGGIFVKNLLISDNGLTTDSPAKVTELDAEAAEGAKLEATVSFNLPKTTIGGDEIAAGAVIEATVTGASVAKVSGAPGERVSAIVTTVQGNNRIAVATAIGELPGMTEYVEVYTGYAIPAAISEVTVTISADMMSAEIAWEAPAEGLDEGVIDPEALTYNVYKQVSNSLVGDYWELIEENVGTTSYTFTAEETAQDVYTFGIAAANVAGVNPSPIAALVVLGTPYTLPMIETFDNEPAYYTYNYWVTYMPTDDYNTLWGVLPAEVLPFFESTEWNVVLCGMGLHDGALGRCGFPVFSTKGHQKVAVKAPFWTGSMSTPDVRITGMTYGLSEPVEVGAVASNGQWNEMTFLLPEELLDKEWVSLYLEASFPEGSSQWVCMDGYTITALSGTADIAASVARARAIEGAIEISAEAAGEYLIFAVDGRVIAAGVTASTPVKVDVAPGLYLVNVAGQTFRLAVK